MALTLTEIEGGEERLYEYGKVIVDIATCGHCGRSWNDALVSAITPTPSARCPFEYEHEYEEDNATYRVFVDDADINECQGFDFETEKERAAFVQGLEYANASALTVTLFGE